MKINIKGLLQTCGIACRHNSGTSGDDVNKVPAKVAFITEKTVKLMREAARTNPDLMPDEDDPDVTYGSIVGLYRDETGVARDEVIPPGETAPYFLSLKGRDIAFTGSHMLSAREELVTETRSGGELSEAHLRALESIQSIFSMVCSAPDTERFNASLIAQSYHAFMIDHFGNFDISIDEESFVRKARADLIRARIGLIDPSHSDAIGTSRELRQILLDAGIEVGLDGIGAEIRSPVAMRINEEAIRRTILSNEKMTKDVFGSLTRTPVDRLSAAMIRKEDLDTLREKKADRRLSGEWIEKVTDLARETTRGASGNYHFSMDIFTEDGRDILVVDDTVGRQQGVAFVYSWPSGERFPVMDIDGHRVMNISREEVPSEVELERLSKILGEIEALGIHDFDQTGQEKSRFAH
jgi:hypothetical protein